MAETYYKTSDAIISGRDARAYTSVEWDIQPEKVDYVQKGGITSEYGSYNDSVIGKLYYYDEGSWHHYGTDGTGTYTGGTLQLCETTDYWGRTDVDRHIGLGCDVTLQGSMGSAQIWLDVPHRAYPPTNLVATKVSDNTIRLTWDNPTVSYDNLFLEVSKDGGSWSRSRIAQGSYPTSYDYYCAPDHSYKFRLVTEYVTESEPSNETSTIYTKPAEPKSMWFSYNGNYTTVHLNNPSNIATYLEYEISSNGTTWGTTEQTPLSDEIIVDVIPGQYIRFRNVCDKVSPFLYSDWLESGPIAVGTKPAKPTWISPATTTVNLNDGKIVWEWSYSNEDNSAQQQFTLEWKRNNVSQTAITQNTSNHYYEMPTASFNAGDVISARVKVKGAGSEWSDFSAWWAPTLKGAPTISVRKPTITVSGMPIEIEAVYSDSSGNFAAGSYILQKDGVQVYPEKGSYLPLTKVMEDNKTILKGSIGVGDFLPANGETYTVVLTARSSSSLQATANATFTTAFTEPQAGELSITNDPETGYASLLATFDNHVTDVEYSGATNAQFDTTAGYVRSLTVEGKSEKWNQLCNPTARSVTSKGITFTAASNGSITVSATSPTGSETFNVMTGGANIPYKTNHKYAFTGGDATVGVQIAFAGVTGSDGMVKTTSDGATVPNVVVAATFTGTYSFHVSVYDLTAIFGAGNEPATVDAFKATDVYKAKLAAGELYEYDAGSLVSIEGAGVWSQELPEGYEPCGYIESSQVGQAYVKTGVIPTINFGFDITFITNDKIGGDSYGCILGGRVSSANKDFQLTTFSGTPDTYQGSLRGGSVSANPAITVGIKQRVLWKNGSLTRADGVTLSYSPNQAGEYELYLFGLNNSGTATQFTIKPARIYRATFYDGSTVVADFVPCVHGTTVGFYDLVSGTFKSNASSTGTLTAGYDDWAPTTTITTPLRSAGSIADELQVDGTDAQVARKVGVVDLGSLTWTLSGYTNIYQATISDIYVPADPSERLDGLACSMYEIDTVQPVNDTMHDMTMKRAWGMVIIRNSSYTSDAAAFKTAMSGVYLFYELAAPTIDSLPDVPLIELGTAAIVTTDLDSTFSMVGWDGSADAVSISVSRVNADGITPLIEDAASGAGAVDKYAPLNTPYQYAVTTKSSAGAINTTFIENLIATPFFFVYYGDEIARAKYNPENGGVQITRPRKTRVYYAGRRDPVSYDGAAVKFSESPSWMFIEDGDKDPFVKLIYDGGRGIYKSGDGFVYHADFELTLNPSYTAIGYYGGIKLDITRIAGEKL